jgi:signal transduction histidine kinase
MHLYVCPAMKPSARYTDRVDQRFLTILAVIVTVGVFLITWLSIRESRADSFQLLVEQGRAFTESLALASENAIAAETFYDYLVRARYSELVVMLLDMDVDRLNNQDWASFALTHDLLGAYVYDSARELTGGVTVRGEQIRPPEHVEAEIDSLFADPETRFVLLLEESEASGQMIHYYLELSPQLDRVIVLAGDASFYSQALSETGIDHLVQAIAREPGIEYIVYQTSEGVVFSSRRLDALSNISDDPFLSQALDADSIVGRIHDYNDRKILELVRPFSSAQYRFGLFRVGLSLDRYYAVSRAFDRQMIILAAVLLLLLLVALAYLRGRRKRAEMVEGYERQTQRRERLSELGNLAAGVAHEIRNPLNAISIAAQRLEREFVPQANQEQYGVFTSQIRTETKRLDEIVTRFLALARDEQKLREIVQLEVLLKEVGELLRVEGDKIGVAVTIDAEPGILIEASADRLKEAFLNLFNNTKEALGGKSGRFDVSARREKGGVLIAVSDDGPGVLPELYDQVFAPYYTTKQGGTGLGLSTVQRIVADLGGDVRIDEHYSGGVRFLIHLKGC